MGAPTGNKNSQKGAKWRRAIRKALAREHGTYSEGLVKIAEKLATAAMQGDAWAIKEIGDRTDGKAAQSVEMSGELSVPMSGTVKFVKSSD